MAKTRKTVEEIKLVTTEGTPESFKEFGQVIGPTPDDEDRKMLSWFSVKEPLVLKVVSFFKSDVMNPVKGFKSVWFYIMSLNCRSLKFSSITHHARVTQCLGSIGGHVWYLGVAKPSVVDSDQGIKCCTIS
ncbi:hypothetical protein POM88_006226 [Heracleum sosnowskyi]|uniref:Uncharacterized protein n=1 Tax=Heracleum sosnowskyi TaxID=360622 RepID=A0AAD8N6A7_9APIA|nr:hypothetical protein POM88_006226 [Heracleum sosnowskyi]